MEMRSMKYYSKDNKKVILRVIPGHFATSHSHVNYYIDMTGLKTRCSEASEVAKALVAKIINTTVIDTIVCMDGCEVVGAFMAEELEKHDFISTNTHETVYIITPELNTNNQMVFRDNIVPAVRNKHVLLLLATTTTGKTINRSLECINYYGGIVTGICSLFSAIDEIKGFPIVSAFTPRDIPGYQAYDFGNCPFCQSGQKIDAFVNGYGYSKL
ncbi:orotate phosphoribosyltransferase [Qiania dongpingensis]|uniref:Orotate phosphoribosyltransferase n=1 Tax=Qiania dongpingensis TaxID=2763669 RepID=A0A7G9G5Z6_9FIRM|nr:orotate phosphoribosyltransferase [Qiania dongpingensis]QNM06228.1 orotate phosphoribosyltransferase [Qiania dongpingensis]